MRLQRIELRRVPGISPPFTLDDLAPGINVIVGPNGSGKTSLCRAVRVVLWPGREVRGRFEVATVWRDRQERTLHGELEGERVRWQIDGVDGEAPTLPAAHLARCFTLGVRDLLQDERETDSKLAHEIRVQMSGGYDLDRVRADRFPERSRGRAKEHREWEKKQAATREIENKFRRLAESEGELPELERRRDAAQQAAQEAPLLDQLIELAQAREELAGVEAEIALLPAELADYSGEEREQLDELGEEVDAATGDVDGVGEELARAREEESEADLPDQELDETERRSWETRVETMRGDQERITRARRDAATARTSLAAARAQLQGHVELEPAPRITPEALAQLETLVDNLHRREAEQSGVELQIQSLDADGGSEPGVDPKENADLLRAWLAAGGSGIPARALYPVLVGALLATLGALCAALFAEQWPGLVGAVAGAAAVGLVLRSLVLSGGDDRASIQGQIRDRGLRAPSTWSRPAVSRAVDELDREASRLGDALARRDRLVPLREQQKQLAKEIAELRARRALCVEQFGIDVGPDLALLVLAQRARAYAEAADQLSEAEGTIASEAKALAGAVESAHAFLEPFGYEPAADVDRLAADLADLAQRQGKFDAARRTIASRVKALEEAQARKQKVERRLRDLYTRRGLPAGDRDGLLQTLNLHGEWEELQTRRRDEASVIARLGQKFSDRPAWIDLSLEAATAQRDRTKAVAGELIDILAQISDIENRVKMARQGQELTEAMEARDAARASLEDAGAKAVHGAAGCFLLDLVAQEHEQTSRPPVLQRAMDEFGAFTRNQYELIAPGSEGAEFRARDTSTGKGLALSQLSDATRIQLLLAVRLAFALSAEGERKLPIMLDEALSTTDPQRFAAVADSLTILASEGRQIFYLTANPADAAHWEVIGKTSSVSAPKIIDLGELRGLQAAVVDPALLAPPRRPAPPRPDGKSPADYARELHVPAIDIDGPVQSLHLYSLLSGELDTLFRVMRRLRIKNVGQWMSFSRSARATGMLEDAQRARLDGLARCARSIFEARAVGRGRPIDRQVLEQSGAVTPVFLERIADLTRDLGGDAEALLLALDERSDERAKGFRDSASEALRTYFDDRGHIDERDELDGAAILLRALDACADELDTGSITTDDCHALVDRLL